MYLSTVIFFCLSVAVSGVYGINCDDMNERSSMVPKNNEKGQSKYTISGFKIEAEVKIGAFDVYVHDEFKKEHLCYRYNGGNVKVVQKDCSQPINGIYITFRTAGNRKLQQVCKIWAIGVGTAAAKVNCYQNTDCAGFDMDFMKSIPIKSADCKSKCLNDDSCRGYVTNFVAGAMRCWHKYYVCSAAQRKHLSGATWCEKPSVAIPGCFLNTDCPGYDITSTMHAPMTPATCRSKCLSDDSCRGYTTNFLENAMRCWHKYYACSAAQRKHLSGATWCEKPSVAIPGCFLNIDCPGHDITYTNGAPMTPATCRSRCLSDRSCRGYTSNFWMNAMRCWHKHHACTAAQRKHLSGATWCEKVPSK